jgi:hypothetical protein
MSWVLNLYSQIMASSNHHFSIQKSASGLALVSGVADVVSACGAVVYRPSGD